ncbi:MAG: hypothetical protein ABJN98_15990 [Roseibium sp.]
MGQRKKKVESEIEAATWAAEQQDTPADDPSPVPMVFTKAPVYWKHSVAVWEECSKVQKAAGRRRPGYRASSYNFST